MRLIGIINETTDFGQAILRRFLEKKDPDKTRVLASTIARDGQEQYAIITADGFLINGNRRKMVLEYLLDKNKGDARYKYMKVIILPGLNELEAPPTNAEIEQIENRYQFQSDGKAEYYNFDMALSVKRKLDLDISLEEILLDDPEYYKLTGKALKDKIKKFEDEYLKPLECVDRYLMYLKRPGHYNTISEGKGDKEGRWQAFIDYYQFYKKLVNDKERIKLEIEEDEIGKIEDIAFKIIRKRVLQGVEKKAHQVMRVLPRLFSNVNAKRDLFDIAESKLNS